LPHRIKKDVYFRWKAITKDPDVDKYVDCAIAANAVYIITNDVHFKALSKMDFPKIEPLNLTQFNEIWERYINFLQIVALPGHRRRLQMATQPYKAPPPMLSFGGGGWGFLPLLAFTLLFFVIFCVGVLVGWERGSTLAAVRCEHCWFKIQK
jgi:hypothetical protein